jgi:hypothetical protein
VICFKAKAFATISICQCFLAAIVHRLVAADVIGIINVDGFKVSGLSRTGYSFKRDNVVDVEVPVAHHISYVDKHTVMIGEVFAEEPTAARLKRDNAPSCFHDLLPLLASL